MKIKIIKSRRRKKTISACLKGTTLEIRSPWFLSDKKINAYAQGFVKKIQDKKLTRNGDFLTRRSIYLYNKLFAKESLFGADFKICWSARQKKIFGICDSKNRKIRISSRLKNVPAYVLDYVIVHELAHLFEPNHSQNFWQRVEKYTKMVRAKGFLEGMFWQKENRCS